MQSGSRATSTPYTTHFAHPWCCDVVQRRDVSAILPFSWSDSVLIIDRSIIRLTLENVSNLPIDFLRLSFDDSTIAPAQQALADGNLSVFDTYETEYDLINRPTFSWQGSKEFKDVAPGQKIVLTVVCFGKVGW
jgi:trafficking protein particle complex subunit 9